MIKYKILNTDQYIIITKKVIHKINAFKQINNLPENGGILFAKFDLPKIYILDISLPTKYDKKNKISFIPDKKQQQEKINQMAKRDLHYVGEWHTHPQKKPVPSKIDLNSMKERFRDSNHELNYFIMLILGTSNNFKDNWISIHNESTFYELKSTSHNKNT